MFTAFENGKVSALLSFMRTLVLLSAAIVIMAYLFGVNGVWWSTPVAEGIAVIMAMYFIFRYRKVYGYL